MGSKKLNSKFGVSLTPGDYGVDPDSRQLGSLRRQHQAPRGGDDDNGHALLGRLVLVHLLDKFET